MNERIRELMKQADYPAPEMAPRAQLLVELIVRECAWIVDNDGSSKDILEHFGVSD